MQNKIIILPWIVFKLLIDIIVSSFVVAYKILSFKKINSYITTEQSSDNDMMTSLRANAITLTPGTISIEANREKIAIHNFDRETSF